MITEIGLVAGDIWDYLDTHGGSARLTDIISSAGKDRSIVLMGIGWLAREGHVVLEDFETNCTVRLRGKNE